MSRTLAPHCVGLLVWSAATANAGLEMHFEVTQVGQEFRYTVFNDEPISSPMYISAFHLSIDAPFTITDTPEGWDYFTDYHTYIDWFNTDSESPYPHDVAPGSQLGGFNIMSTSILASLQPFIANSWDHTANSGGHYAEGLVLAPSSAAVPEPSTLVLTISSAAILGAARLFRRRG